MSRNNNNSLLLQIETVEELRRRIIDKNYLDPRKLESNTFLLRYLKFFHMDISKAEKMLKNYWKYCNSKKLECFAIEIPNRYKPIFQIYAGARDYQNRPVIQVPNIKDWQWKLSNGFDKTDELFVSMLFKRLHWYLEKELLAIDAEYAIIILDFQDMPYTFSLAKQVFNLCVEFIKELMPVSPNIFAQSIVVNAPKVAKRLNRVAQTVLRYTPEQRDQCIIFSPGDIDWKEQLLNFVPANQLRPEFGGTFTGYQVWP